MNNSALPRRPHPAASYRPVARLATLASSFRFALPPSTEGGSERPPAAEKTKTPETASVEIVDFALTTRLSGQRLADTWSWGLFRLASGQTVRACTTFGRKGFLLLEVEAGAHLSEGDAAAIARAFVAGHVRERARQARQSAGRN